MNDEIIIEECNIDEIVMQDEENDEISLGDTIIYKKEKDYNKLENQPQINNVTLIENKSLDELGIQPKGDYPENRITNTELEEIFNGW